MIPINAIINTSESLSYRTLNPECVQDWHPPDPSLLHLGHDVIQRLLALAEGDKLRVHAHSLGDGAAKGPPPL